MDINQTIQAYHLSVGEEHHRYRSWEHCYSYFRRTASGGLASDRDQAALQMAFYLASWGMYRGSSFLLQYAYTVHLGLIDMLSDPCFSVLWETEFGASQSDQMLIPKILDLISCIRSVYRPFVPTADSQQPTDTLITKIILGTFGCLPACDRYFIEGFKSAGYRYSYLNKRFIERILLFCHQNLHILQEEQKRIMSINRVYYPLMKIIDMHFWQIGFDKGKTKVNA